MNIVTLINKIRNYDPTTQKVYELLCFIKELEQHGELREYWIDVCNLNSLDLPEDVDTSFPVWSMDYEGNLLVGETIDEVITLKEYYEYKGK